ncbi:amino acid adenylation domain-containing protein [Streptomyces sp. TX20-6-3]|uniref:non-ribosomal peptide synthetase n=1 Tax=Streptomyces sp. TX20-6-3 TaxID=3028705 RepID=UPI0029B800B8|nr:non-ribosomal peptide synthetase [Streptomyces sp. TX20-6-3]MDX2565196.1 amino acid adenylation domain-containing protein [Streptomyces sp. TX20-6-3]
MSERHSPQESLPEPWPGAGLGTVQDFPSTVVHHIVDHWAQTAPDAVALSGPGGEVTYQELVHQANRLGNYLVSAGAGKGTRIGVCLPRGTDAVIAFLAVLKTGGGYVPLDPALPQDRLDYMAEDAELAAVLTAETLRRDRDLITAHPDTPPAAAVTDRDIAYVIYTSGSTGRPKGVQVQHGSIVDMVTCAEHTRLGRGSRVLHAASVSFDAAVLEIWSALLTGSQLVIAEPGPLSPKRLGQLLGQATDAFLPTALFHRQVEESPGSFSGLRTLMVGGEALEHAHAVKALQHSPGLRLVNLYGPTEVTVYATYHVLTDPEKVPSPVPIGRPAPNARLRVLGADQQDAPAGEAGELCVGGPGLAAGYLGRPELTAERFIADPDDPSQRLYRTGDLVSWNADGTLAYRGRIDDQVKLHGYRIEPGEIGTVLARHAEVSQALVLRREDRPGHPYLAAYYTSASGMGVPEAELRQHASRALPTWMVPQRFIVLEAMPLTATGKIDTAALPEPDESRSELLPALVPPRTGTEEEIAAVWRRALGLREVGVEDAFAVLGGTSLAAMRIAAAIGKQFGVNVPLSALLPEGTVAAVASLVEQARTNGTGNGMKPFPRTERDRAVPATPGQQGLWFHDQAHPDSAVYSEILPLRLRGPLDAGVLQRCLEQLVMRHEPLRTALVMDGGQLVQQVQAAAEVVLARVDLTALAEGERDAVLAQAVRWVGGRPFDLTGGPHVRAHLIRVAEQDSLLVLSMHHAAVDGWSANILFEELAVLYQALTGGGQPSLQRPPVQFADFAAWQHEQLERGGFEADVAYWRKQLAGVPEQLVLSTDLPRPEQPSGQGALARTRLPGDLMRQIDGLAQTTGCTRYMVLLAAFQTLLARYTATDDIVVGTPASGRTHPDLDRAVGYFISMLPLRTRMDTAVSFRDLLTQVRSTVLEAHEHQQLPFPQLVQACGLDTQSLTPLVQVALVPEDVYAHRFTLGSGLSAEFEYHDLGIAKYDLTLALIPDSGGDGLRINAEYRTDLFHPASVERLLDHLHTLLGSATLTPDARLADLTMLTTAERAQLCGGFDGPVRDVPTSTAVHDLVAQWAKDTPDAVAVTEAGTSESLTYAGLEARASRLAHYLAERGADPGARIGVCLPRGTDAVVAFLAVLKAGCAYVPLDPAHPRERLEYMAQDAQLALEITPDLLQRDAAMIAACPVPAPAIHHQADDIAYVIYTSGSTGLPKGVEVTHRNVVDLVAGAEYAQLSTGTRHLHAASISFDMATFEIWATLATGGRLVVASPPAMTTDQFSELVRTEGITHAHLPTALFHRRVEEDPACLKGLHTVMVGGEALKTAHAIAALRSNPGLRLINGYGPTETTVYATWHVLTDPDLVPSPVPIGRPTPNTRARVFDQDLRPVPVGTPGELYIGGPGLAAGYLQRPELTAERFIPDPDDPSERLYRTGDLVSWNTDGTLTYQGRTDDQIKLHGYRVEPGEIETVLESHPAVARALVVKREDQPGSPYLAAYCTAVPDTEISPHQLTDLAASRLPSYLVPRVCMILEQFPLTRNGKVDRAGLPVPQAADHPSDTDNKTEQEVATIWRSVIMADTIRPDERLFDIGGASLHVAQIHQLITEHFRLTRLRMTDLFAHPTIRTYSAHIRTLQADRPQEDHDSRS